MMMTCDDFALEELVFGELAPEAALELRAHLGKCERCRVEHARLISEQALFAARRRDSATHGAMGPLPDIDQILARAEARNTFTKKSEDGGVPSARGLFGALATARARVPRVERFAIAAALAVIAVGVALRYRSGPTDSAPAPSATAAIAHTSESRAARAGIAPGARRSDFVFAAAPPTRSTQSALSLEATDPLPVSVMVVDTHIGDACEQSLNPGTLDRIVSSSSAMCVPDPI
jgi:anti-sigma factor RsiW